MQKKGKVKNEREEQKQRENQIEGKIQKGKWETGENQDFQNQWQISKSEASKNTGKNIN